MSVFKNGTTTRVYTDKQTGEVVYAESVDTGEITYVSMDFLSWSLDQVEQFLGDRCEASTYHGTHRTRLKLDNPGHVVRFIQIHDAGLTLARFSPSGIMSLEYILHQKLDLTDFHIAADELSITEHKSLIDSLGSTIVHFDVLGGRRLGWNDGRF